MNFETPPREQDVTVIASMPKGGGAIRGIGETFRANPATGTASFSVPLPFSAARALTPQHALSYDSGSGNGAFGLGWSVDLPQISRKTQKALPTYDNDQDTFVLGGAELVPVLRNGAQVGHPAQERGRTYRVRLFRPRIESGFDRLELWQDTNSGETHWRVWSASNVVTIYGDTEEARLADPTDASRIFGWKIARVFDASGNLTLYEYRQEDDAGVTPGHPLESARWGRRQAQVYPHRILYGNRTPFAGDVPDATDFCFRTTFDYGETDPLTARDTLRPWALREDGFSQFRAGFEIRTRRLCTRVVTEHLFPEIGPAPECVQAIELHYGMGSAGQALLEQVQSAGFTRADQTSAYTAQTLPPLRFAYTTASLDTRIHKVRDTGGEAIVGAGTGGERWVDLYGQALPGLLSAAAGGMMFRENLGNGVLGDAQALALQPSIRGLDEVVQVEDRLGRGGKQFTVETGTVAGLYKSDLPEAISPFRPFAMQSTQPTNAPTLRRVDLTGDGLVDQLCTNGTHLVWYRAAEDGGFQDVQRVALPVDGTAESAFLFSDTSGLTFLADMSGDGLLDVVRVSPRAVRYWPNLGYGRFAAAVEMATPPVLSTEGALNPDHLRLADVSGTGMTDILWLGQGSVTLWLNRSGQAFDAPLQLDGLIPDGVPVNEVAVTDLLGQGSACLSWTGRQSGLAQGQRLYVDLYSGVKSDLLERVENGFGGLTELRYRASTSYALDAARAGRPWVTKLHFPVHCLASTRMSDAVTGYSIASSYAYHHGYYDPEDREFRGFARVDQYDSETLTPTGQTDQPRAFFQPTRLSRTWFHTGARHGNQRLEQALAAEFYAGGQLPLDQLAPELPNDLSDHDWGEAQRALKGSLLRSEVYALDDSAEAAHPYAIEFDQLHLRLLQASRRLGQREVPAVFQVLQRQSVSIGLDRNPDDPRVSQTITLDWNDWGMPLRGVTVLHGRWGAFDDDTPEPVQALQRTPVLSYSELRMSTADDNESRRIPPTLLGAPLRRLPLGYEASSFELRGIMLPQHTLVSAEDLETQISGLSALPYSDLMTPTGRRRISASRSYFAAEDLNEAMPLGEVGPLGAVHHTENLAFTQDCLSAIYGDRIGTDDLAAAGYLRHADDSADWWAPSGRSVYDPAPETRFYLPVGARDPFGNETQAHFDAHLLTVTQSSDALGNTSRVVTDYRRMAPVLSRDPNGNWTAVSSNGLGQPLALAAMGKVAGVDTPTGHEPCEGSTLARPSAILDYDLTAWPEGRGPSRVSKTVFEDHGSATSAERPGLVSHDFTDGFGNLVMSKLQQAPGPAQRLRADGTVEEIDTSTQSPPAMRWLGNGRAILNNKGKPLRQYEPYFSVTPAYEDDAALVEQGISVLPFYDAAERAIGQLNPDGSWVKARHTPWRRESWDAADTCLLDPAEDDQLGAHFTGLPGDLWQEGWIARRAGGARGTEAQAAAEASAAHAATPAISHLDAAGRAVLAVADNGTSGRIATQTQLDVEGNTLAVIDDAGRTVVSCKYTLMPPPDTGTPKPPLWQSSVDQGETRTFLDCMGRPAVGWDALGRRVRTTYDALSRPVEVWLQPPDGPERRIALTLYGENAPDAEARNLRGAVWQSFDSAGWSQTGANDFLGNPLSAERRVLAGLADAPHWPDDPVARAAMLDAETYRTSTDYDAMSRPLRSVLPQADGAPDNIQFLGYDSGGALAWVEAQAAGGPRQRYVDQITYDAKGQRQSVRYGNGVVTRYAYDRETYRLKRLVTQAEGGEALQDLAYTYDILGNVTAIRDATQPVIHHGNSRIEPVARYTYDALSRLIEATGREHIQQTGAPDWSTGLNAAGQINDLTQLRHYTQFYAYDPSGNILSMRHVAEGNSWTRHYGYDPDSHRLEWTNIGRDDAVGADRFDYNAAGSMLSLPHLGHFVLNASEQMVEVDLGGGGRAVYTYDSSGARVRKRVERTGSIVEEQLYLGSLEVYRKWVNGALRLRRETQHVADDTGTIALIETRTHNADGAIASPERLARYQLGNHLGSATLELDSAGVMLTREEYHPYGTTAFFASAPGRALPPKRYRYTGMEKDDETGLHYHGARFYAPWLGRWTTADPIGIGDGLNVYAYVGGNPVGLLDPTGTQDQTASQPFIPTIRAVTEEETVWEYFYKHAGSLSPTQEAQLNGDFIWPETMAASAEWHRQRELFAEQNADVLAAAVKRDDARIMAERQIQFESGLLNDTRDMIPISDMNEDELTNLFQSVGTGPFMLFFGSTAHGSSPPMSLGNVAPAQVFDAGTVTVVDYSSQGRVPPNARVLAQIVQQAMNEFGNAPSSIQHYLSPNMIRAYRGSPSILGPLFTGRAIENYTSSYLHTVPGLLNRISSVGGPNAPDNIIGMGSRPSAHYGFTDTHPRGTHWGEAHELRFYLQEGRTGVPAFGIQYDVFPAEFHTEAIRRNAPNYIPRWESQIRRAQLVRPAQRAK
jgi:RHS repeat-associated protein